MCLFVYMVIIYTVHVSTVNFDLHGQRTSLFCFTSVFLFNSCASWLIKLTIKPLRSANMPVVMNKMILSFDLYCKPS